MQKYSGSVLELNRTMHLDPVQRMYTIILILDLKVNQTGTYYYDESVCKTVFLSFTKIVPNKNY